MNQFRKPLGAAILLIAILLAGCATPVPAPTASPAPATAVDLPKITSVTFDRSEVSNYEPVEATIVLDAKYTNPYDVREVRLDATFSGPNNEEMKVPGFWDGDSAWKVRFTPPAEGAWNYSITVSDGRGTSPAVTGQIEATPSDLHGWIQAGDLVDPSYSPHYLAYHDGTPFYGIGHCDALNILIDGFDPEKGVELFDNMQAVGENYVVWWPMYTNSLVSSSYDKYSTPNMKVIDAVIRDAEKKNVLIVFTVWDHPNLRDNTHAWGTGNWERNGFKKLGSIDSFFTSDEAWAWQENLYRYIIARWGYSPAIAMWMTVSEINGTNAYAQTDPWHKKVNDYFVTNDPYRHPTTASMSGDTDWEAGHLVMDVPQVHIYALKNPVEAAETTAYWTSLMWQRAAKPNWVGEFGVTDNNAYPELFHNSIWAALATGAAMTPAEWNSGGSFGRMTPEMNADINRLGQFVATIPLVQWNPNPLQITASDPQVRAWGVAGADGGLFWVQDFSLAGKTAKEIRAEQKTRTGVTVELGGLPAGTYTITPYDTWSGTWLAPIEVQCTDGQACSAALPDFKADMAFKIEKK
jgi:hypothetical protein